MGKYLIVGIGNYEKEYEGTRHNVGFYFVDRLIKQINEKTKQNYEFSSDRYAYKCDTKIMGRSVIVIKPTTFVNLSGKAVVYWMDKEAIDINNMLIIVDDLALPVGTLRLRYKGSSTHNGLRNIIDMLGTDRFNRMRVGIGNDYKRGDQIDYVLNKFGEEEKQLIDKGADKMYEIIKCFVMLGMDKTMNVYNRNE